MASGWSDYLMGKVTDHMTGGAVWVQPANLRLQLCTTAPSDSDPGTWLTGGSWDPPVIPWGVFDDTTDTVESDATVSALNVPAAAIVGAVTIDEADNVYHWTDEVSITFAGGENPEWTASQIRHLFE